MQRLKVISGHLCPPGARQQHRDLWRTECGSVGGSSPDDVVVVHGLRTAIGKAKRGAFKVKQPPPADLRSARIQLAAQQTPSNTCLCRHFV